MATWWAPLAETVNKLRSTNLLLRAARPDGAEFTQVYARRFGAPRK
jgi:hypothetical protein